MQLKDRIVLITGASRGIGAAVARRFAREGAQLILVARKSSGLEAIDNEIQALTGQPATLVPFDLKDSSQIKQLAVAIAQRFGRLDALVGNAGVLGNLAPLAHLDAKVWQSTLDTNLTANFHLLQSCDPLLRQSPSGRVIMVSAAIASEHRPYFGHMIASKRALDGLVQTYAEEVAKTSIKANLIAPRAVDTDLLREAFPGGIPDSLHAVAPDSITDTFADLAAETCQDNGKTVVI